jgi:hypothetical protein
LLEGEEIVMRNSGAGIGILMMLLFGIGIGSATLNGQIGGFIKKKATGIVKEPDTKTPEAAAAQSDTNKSPRFNENVLELNADNLAKLEKALVCEKEFRDGVEAKYAKLPTRQQYENCMMQVMMSPEAQSITANKSGDVMQMSKQLMDLQEKKCGKSPSSYNKSDELRPAQEQGAKCGGITLTQYSIATERIPPFCNSGGKEKVKGFGDLYYVYTHAEVNAIQPKCARLSSLINSLNEPAKK